MASFKCIIIDAVCSVPHGQVLDGYMEVQVKYQIDGARVVVAEQTQPSPFPDNLGQKIRIRYLILIDEDDPIPLTIIATVLLMERVQYGWVIQHLVVADESRRRGWAEKIVLALEHGHGLDHVGAMWVSETGMAFARRFIEKHGPRPLWRFATDPEVIKRVMGVTDNLFLES